jgi:hypothetical protein
MISFSNFIVMTRALLTGIWILLSLQTIAQRHMRSLPDVNYEDLVSRASITYDKPVTKSEEGLPIGNGRMGSLVWTSPSAIRFQLNRVDVFANNAASNNFFERHTDYCSGIGFVDVDFLTNDVFDDGNFRQHLSCYDGLMNIKGGATDVDILAWNEQDVMAVRIEGNQVSSNMIHISLRALRAPLARRGNHQAKTTLKVIDNKLVLVQEFKEDEYYCSSSVVIDIIGGGAVASLVNETTLRLSVPSDGNSFTIMMSSSASFDPKHDIIAASVEKLELAKAKGFDGLYQSNKAWWKDFWERAFVQLRSGDGKADFIEKNYTYYLYVMASSSRGTYPPKFNGMIWTTGGDERKWGNLYWGANQSCLYNALFPANRDELLNPMFKMYSAMRKSCEVAARQQWGSKGIFIPETVAFDGLPILPDDIAAEMQHLYLLKKPWQERSQKFMEYAVTKMPFQSRWNWKKDEGWKEGRWHTSDKGAGPFGHTTHIFSRGAKIAYQYWLRYEYTQDKAWLRNEAYPMLKGVAEFYRNFPNVKKEADNTYHIYNLNDNESVLGGHNTAEEISSMRGIFPVAIKAAEILGIDSDLRKVWKDFLRNLSPLPLRSEYTKMSPSQPDVWARSLPPVIQGDGGRLPDPNTLPAWFFDLCTLESDKIITKVANATFDAYFPDGIDDSTSVNVLSKLPGAGSLLGRTEATEYLIHNQIETSEIQVMPNRMDMREGFQAISIQRLGRAAEALHYALCQSVPPYPGAEPVIRIFPAWPKKWDARFKLLCRGAFLVSASMRNGHIDFVEIISQGGNVCRIRSPWPGSEVIVYRNNKRWKNSKGDLLVFNTEIGDRIVLELR